MIPAYIMEQAIDRMRLVPILRDDMTPATAEDAARAVMPYYDLEPADPRQVSAVVAAYRARYGEW